MPKTILITGASSGLGRALAELLLAKGHRVYGASRRARELSLPFEKLNMDVGDEKSVQAAIDKVIETEGKIDVLINNAGIGIAGPLEQLQLANVRKAFDTNVFGPIRVCQAVMPHMRRAGGGRIINISSIGAAFGLPYRGVYCATKAALDLISESIRMEAARFGIQCCSIRAGDMQTDINSNRLKDFDPNDPAYNNSFQKVYELIDKDVNKGMPVAEAARQIAAIVERERLKRTYLVGKPLQKISIFAKQLLPAAWFEKIIRKYSGM